MRGKRSKQYRKLMQQYALVFGFREPYQVLVDAAMLLDLHRFNMNISTTLTRTLHGQVKPMITQCSMRHLHALQTRPQNTTTSSTSPAPSHGLSAIDHQTKEALISSARTFERRRCNHHEFESPLSTLECFQDVLDPKSGGTNRHRYILATQDADVRSWARQEVNGVPMVYVKRSVAIMEPMAEGDRKVKMGLENGKLRASARGPSDVKRKRGNDDGREEVKGDRVDGQERKKQRVGGPNPLSVKKPKKRRSVYK